tara:strand:- start:23 stop:220 length:198 start_codon:yes stop_codon:yes gene_type:complete
MKNDYYKREELVEIIKNFAYACNWDTADHDMAEHLGEKYFPIFLPEETQNLKPDMHYWNTENKGE